MIKDLLLITTKKKIRGPSFFFFYSLRVLDEEARVIVWKGYKMKCRLVYVNVIRFKSVTGKVLWSRIIWIKTSLLDM